MSEIQLHSNHINHICTYIILLPGLKQYADEIIGDHQCEIRHNRSITDQIFYIRQILEKKGSTIV
jgi:hypothetical protein